MGFVTNALALAYTMRPSRFDPFAPAARKRFDPFAPWEARKRFDPFAPWAAPATAAPAHAASRIGEDLPTLPIDAVWAAAALASAGAQTLPWTPAPVQRAPWALWSRSRAATWAAAAARRRDIASDEPPSPVFALGPGSPSPLLASLPLDLLSSRVIPLLPRADGRSLMLVCRRLRRSGGGSFDFDRLPDDVIRAFILPACSLIDAAALRTLCRSLRRAAAGAAIVDLETPIRADRVGAFRRAFPRARGALLVGPVDDVALKQLAGLHELHITGAAASPELTDAGLLRLAESGIDKILIAAVPEGKFGQYAVAALQAKASTTMLPALPRLQVYPYEACKSTPPGIVAEITPIVAFLIGGSMAQKLYATSRLRAILSRVDDAPASQVAAEPGAIDALNLCVTLPMAPPRLVGDAMHCLASLSALFSRRNYRRHDSSIITGSTPHCIAALLSSDDASIREAAVRLAPHIFVHQPGSSSDTLCLSSAVVDVVASMDTSSLRSALRSGLVALMEMSNFGSISRDSASSGELQERRSIGRSVLPMLVWLERSSGEDATPIELEALDKLISSSCEPGELLRIAAERGLFSSLAARLSRHTTLGTKPSSELLQLSLTIAERADPLLMQTLLNQEGLLAAFIAMGSRLLVNIFAGQTEQIEQALDAGALAALKNSVASRVLLDSIVALTENGTSPQVWRFLDSFGLDFIAEMKAPLYLYYVHKLLSIAENVMLAAPAIEASGLASFETVRARLVHARVQTVLKRAMKKLAAHEAARAVKATVRARRNRAAPPAKIQVNKDIGGIARFLKTYFS